MLQQGSIRRSEGAQARAMKIRRADNCAWLRTRSEGEVTGIKVGKHNRRPSRELPGVLQEGVIT
jgi:hypothetical protein